MAKDVKECKTIKIYFFKNEILPANMNRPIKYHASLDKKHGEI